MQVSELTDPHCVVCGQYTTAIGPFTTQCPSGHVVQIRGIETKFASTTQDTTQAETWRDRKPML